MGASCILAALIIAGSSFAWFTSKDEVSNRLSANADYGVKIVESFAPPMNWLPGQEVNKDVYATNTGNIAAFVKEEVSGVMTVTTEKNTPSKTAKSLELKPEERYAIEAGAFLAYKPNGSTKVLGDIAVVRPNDAGDPTVTDFTPDETGLYVFRRVINVNETTKAENFESDGTYAAVATDGTTTVGYEGYYFDKNANKYYKISNLTVKEDNTVDKADDHNKTDGNLLYASAGFVERQQKVLDPVDLKYEVVTAADVTAPDGKYKDKGITAGKYLVASYDTGDSNSETELKVLGDLYDKAVHQLEYAKQLADSAADELTAAQGPVGQTGTTAYADDAFTTASSEFDVAKTRLENAKKALEDATIANNKAKAEFEDAERAYGESREKLYGKEGDTYGTAAEPKAGSLKKIYDAATAAWQLIDEATDFSLFKAELEAYMDDASATKPAGSPANKAEVTAITDEAALKAKNYSVDFYESFKTWLSGKVSGEEHGEEHSKYATLADYLIAKKNYDDEYVAFSAVSTGYEAVYNTKKDAYDKANPKGTMQLLADAQNEFTAAETDFKLKASNYKTAFDDKVAAHKVADEKQQKKNEADTIFANAQNEYNSISAKYNAKVNKVNTDTFELKDGVIKSDGTLDIFIKLSDKVVADADVPTTNDQWLLKPNPVVNDKADFYYTGILESGETTSKLIDSVILGADATQNMYKSFDFDLNVAMKSAQITYKDNDTISAEAAPQELGQYANLKDNKDINTPVKWVDTKALSEEDWT